MEKQSKDLQEQLISQAEQLFEQKKYQEALAIGEELVKNYPDQMMSLYVRGRARWGMDDYDGALVDLGAAISMDSSFYLSHYYQGNALSDLKRYEEAVECFNHAIELNPKHTFSYFKKGYSLGEMKRHKEAIECYNRAIHLDPKDAIAYNNKGISLASMKHYKEAIECYDRTIELNPKYANAYYGKGISLASMERYEEAIECYDRVIELNPKYANAYYGKGISLDSMERYKEALECYDRAIELNPKYANAYYGKGISLDKMKRYEEAIECYNRAIELDPKNANAYNNKGVALRKMKRYDEAVECYNRAIELNPKYATAYNNKGFSLESLNRYEEALVCYSKALALDSNHFKALNNRIGLEDKIKNLPTSSSPIQVSPRVLDDKTVLSDNQTEETSRKESVPKNLEQIAQNVIKRFSTEEHPPANMDMEKTYTAVVPLNELENLMNRLYDNEDHTKLENRVLKNNLQFKQFTSAGLSPEIDQPDFYVLRRWNSYTPIVAEDNSSSKGGGYFIHLGEHGIVIDPGFNFIENFKNHGFKFSQISQIFISHAHNDHTADLESIRTLLYIYNKDLKKEIYEDLEELVLGMKFPNQENMSEEDLYREVKSEWSKQYKEQRKVIDIYLTPSTFKKYSPDLNLSEKNEYRIHLINADSLPIDGPRNSKLPVTIHPIPSKHNDLLSDCDAVGFAIEFPALAIIYTGDTCFNWEIGNKYHKLSKQFKKKKHGIVLLAHIGGFKKWERYRSENRILNGSAFYANHLGRNGLICLTAHLNPTFCILSEFGEEFRGDREVLASQFAKVFEEKNIPFIPADTGLCMRADGMFWVINSFNNGKIERGFASADNVGTISSSDATTLIYCLKRIAEEYSERRWQIEAALKKDTSSIKPVRRKE